MRGAHLLARAAVAVRQIRRDRELTLLADAHATQPVIPAFDDLAFADGEVEGLFPGPGWGADFLPQPLIMKFLID